jgi:hypothetical protein
VGDCWRTNWLAAAGLTVILPEVALVSVPSVTLSVYVPAVSKTRLLNVATPLTAAALVVLPVVNPPGPLATAIVTVDVLPVITLPKASVTAALTEVLSA